MKLLEPLGRAELGSTDQLNKPRIVEVEEVAQNTPTVKTLFFRDENSSRAPAGRFLMVWTPDSGEIPMSVSIPHHISIHSSITVRKVGKTSTALYGAKRGDKVGIRGPYGRGFSIDRLREGRVLLVGGGTGLAPLARLVFQKYRNQIENQFSLDFVIAAKKKDELIFYRDIEQMTKKPDGLFATTDDGSFGFKGLAHEFVRSLLKSKEYSSVFSCGPELMMRSVYGVTKAHAIRHQQHSLERLMKCAVGLCGSCSVGRYLLCSDGPVLDEFKLKEIEEEFGKVERDHSGRLIAIGPGRNKHGRLGEI